MWGRNKRSAWVFGLAFVLLIVVAVRQGRERRERRAEGQRLVTLEVNGETIEIFKAWPGATVVPTKESQAVAGRSEVAPTLAEEKEELLVEVVTGDGTRAVGATVAMLDTLRRFVSPGGLVPRTGDPDDDFDLALRVTTDAHGEARLPRPRGNVRMAAWHEGSYGELALFAGEPGPVRLVLAEEVPLEVRVVHGDGSPVVGIPVVLRTAKEVVARRRTREDGIVLLWARARRAELERGAAFVQLGVPLREAVLAPVPARLGGPIELVAPPLGAVDVRLLEGNAEFRGAADVRLGITDRLREELAPEANFTFALDGLAHEGRARFEHVGLGLELFVAVEPEHRAETGREFAGPLRADHAVEVQVTVGDEAVWLAGRLRGARGAALGQVWTEFRLEMSGLWATRVALTDSDGGFAVAYPDSPEAISAVSLVVRVDAPAETACEGTFPVRLRSGMNELGELVLTPLPLLVAGRVRDEGGAPLAGLALEVLSLFDPANPASGVSFTKVVTDAFGRFALHRAPPLVGGLGLRVRHRALRWGSEAVAPGTGDLEIVVRATGKIEVRTLFDGFWYPSLSLLQGGVPVIPQAKSMGGQGSLLFFDVLPGEYDLEWSHYWASERGFVRSLRVVAGEETRDPRLDPLDLRGAWPRMRLTVIDEAGAAIPAVTLELDRGNGYQNYSSQTSTGVLDLVAGPLPMRARLSAHGFRAREFELEADATIVLTRGPLLRLVVPTTLPDLPREWHWAVWVRAEDRSDSMRQPLPLAVGTNELALEAAGPYRLVIGAVRRLEKQSDEAGGSLAYRVEVTDEGKTLTLEPFEADFVAELLAEIAELDPYAPR